MVMPTILARNQGTQGLHRQFPPFGKGCSSEENIPMARSGPSCWHQGTLGLHRQFPQCGQGCFSKENIHIFGNLEKCKLRWHVCEGFNMNTWAKPRFQDLLDRTHGFPGEGHDAKLMVMPTILTRNQGTQGLHRQFPPLRQGCSSDENIPMSRSGPSCRNQGTQSLHRQFPQFGQGCYSEENIQMSGGHGT